LQAVDTSSRHGASLQALYGIKQTASADAQLLNGIREAIGANLSALYDVLQSGVVSADMAATYNTLAHTGASAQLPHSILVAVAQDAQLVHRILGVVGAEMTPPLLHSRGGRCRSGNALQPAC